jgi:hypothetical protein
MARVSAVAVGADVGAMWARILMATQEFAAAPPGPLANGRHRVEVRARCLGGNAAVPRRAAFEIRRPPAEIRLEPWPAWDGEASQPIGVQAAVRDRLGLAVADSTIVELRSPERRLAATRGGEAVPAPAAFARWSSPDWSVGGSREAAPAGDAGSTPCSGTMLAGCPRPRAPSLARRGRPPRRTNPDGAFAARAGAARGERARFLPAVAASPAFPRSSPWRRAARRRIAADLAGGGS